MHYGLIRSKLFPVILICCLGSIIYSNTFNNSFQFDDEHSIINNLSIRDLGNLPAIWNFGPTHFITHLSLAVNYHFHQLRVFGYHLFNLAVHLGASLLVWWLSLLTLSTAAMEEQNISCQRNLIALCAGLIFVAHPIQTQAVTYIIQRATSLAAFFYLASLSLYAQSRILQYKIPDSRAWLPYYAGALLAAGLAMFSKEPSTTLPVMVLLYEFCFFRKEKGINWKPAMPFLILLPVIPITRLMTKPVIFNKAGIMMLDLEPITSGWQYLLTQFRVMATYIRLLLLPLNQNLDYDYRISQRLTEPAVLASFLLLACILVIAVRIFRKYRLISFGIFWFFLTLLPESSIIPIGDVIYEHRLYLPMAGYSLFLATITYRLFAKKSLKPMVAAMLIIIPSYSALTYQRNFVWKDVISLWSDTVRKSPRKARPYHSRGAGLFSRGSLDEALSDFNKAIELSPGYTEAYCNRGVIYQNKGSVDEALADFSRAIEIDPRHAQAYYDRGFIYQTKGDLQEAISDYDKAIQIKPNFPEAYYNRGLVYQTKGNLEQALADYGKAIEITPGYAEAYNNRGSLYVYRGELDQAVSDFSRALEMNPKHARAYNNRAAAYFLKQEYNKSWSDIQQAQALGYQVNPELLEGLKKATGR